MRRWNGWGDGARDFPLTPAALEFLAARLGKAARPQDATLEQALGPMPASRLEAHPFLDMGAESRLRHARGQSFADWIALRAGRAGPFPDAVATPDSAAGVSEVLHQAQARGAIVIPWGGGTSVAGHLDVPAGGRPVISLSLGRLTRLCRVDPVTRLATFEAGTPGPQVEAQLRPHGFLLGHFPQSYEYSTAGGWIVTRSSGQQSLRYGRIEPMLHAATLATPRGEWRVGGVPASAAGPDLREVVLGSEGRLGVVTEAVLRVRPLPAEEAFHAVFFPDWERGLTAVRALGQSEIALSLLRLSNEVETATQLALAGHARTIAWLERYLRWRGADAGKVMLLVGVTGDAVRPPLRAALALCRTHGGVHAGPRPGAAWVRNRFHSAYLRNSLWDAGYGVDTMETCLDWPRVTEYMRAVEQAARAVFEPEGERVHAYTHLSHVYRQGCSAYSTFVWRLCGDADRELERWRRFKAAVSGTIVRFGGTISHQHGVGSDHAPYLAAEKGDAGMRLLRAIATEMDPAGLMNPGKLLA